MDWTFTDSFDNHTMYQQHTDTAIRDGSAEYSIQGKDAENKNVSFSYEGTMDLSDGQNTFSFLRGSVTEKSSDGDSIHSIAKQYGISTKELAIINQTVIIETAQAYGHHFDDVIEYANYLFPGEELLVPCLNSRRNGLKSLNLRDNIYDFFLQKK